MINIKMSSVFLMTLFLYVQGFSFDKLRLVYTSIGIGTWTTLNPGFKSSFLNSFKPDFYFNSGNLTWHIGVPLQYSIEHLPKNEDLLRKNEIIKYSFNAVDIATDIGWRIGIFQPIIGIVLPTGYNASDYSGAWVGSGNRKVVAGLNVSLGKYEDKIRGGANFNISSTINGLKDGAAFGAGVIAVSGSLKGTLRINKYWESSADVYITHSNYGKNWEKVQPGWKESMRTSSIVPALSVRRKLSAHTDAGLRAGYGRSFDPHDSSKKPTQVIVGGISVAIY